MSKGRLLNLIWTKDEKMILKANRALENKYVLKTRNLSVKTKFWRNLLDTFSNVIIIGPKKRAVFTKKKVKDVPKTWSGWKVTGTLRYMYIEGSQISVIYLHQFYSILYGFYEGWKRFTPFSKEVEGNSNRCCLVTYSHWKDLLTRKITTLRIGIFDIPVKNGGLLKFYQLSNFDMLPFWTGLTHTSVNTL